MDEKTFLLYMKQIQSYITLSILCTCVYYNNIGETIEWHCDTYWHLSSFCSVIRISATMAPFLNNLWIHGCLVFRVVCELPARSALFSVMATWSETLLTAWAMKGNFLMEGLSNSLSIFWILFCIVHSNFMKPISSWRVAVHDPM
jgi:hypothetical protein